MKLKTSEIKAYRLQQLELQDHCCALCGEPINDDAVLDHDHRSGFLRKVLHRGCNALLGHIENNMPRNLVTLDRLAVIAQRLIEYKITKHTEIRHPTHFTKEERKMKKAMGRGKGKKPPKR